MQADETGLHHLFSADLKRRDAGRQRQRLIHLFGGAVAGA